MFLGSAAPSGHLNILLTLLVMWVAAKVLAELFERMRQPAVVGEILAGIIIGPSMLAWVEPNDITFTLAEIGVIFLLFTDKEKLIWHDVTAVVHRLPTHFEVAGAANEILRVRILQDRLIRLSDPDRVAASRRALCAR